MKNFRWMILAAFLLAAPTVSHAQAPAAGGQAPAAADSGAVNNSTTESTTTTTTSAPGIAPSDETTDTTTTGTTQLANTGGEPILMSLVGLSLAMGAFALRRRFSN